ncbi:hypothetical protein AAF712_016788 [Marasmius tenuissimus]|uniref:Uncharacterized protein n=1 Tax=Marasmius tenuissimus TaxID=585030 RepID=A0ABR2Z7Z9_9AGAR
MPATGQNATVQWSRDPSKDPRNFQLVWRFIDRPAAKLPGIFVDVLQDIAQDVAQVQYPAPGRYHIAIFAVTPDHPTGDFICTGAQAIEVLAPSNSISISSGPSSISTTSTGDEEGETSSRTNDASTSKNREGSKTTLFPGFPSTTAESPPHNASQIPSSTRIAVGPIVGGAIGGVLALGLILFAFRWYLQKRRSKAQGPLNIDPFPAHHSEPKALSPGSGDTTTQQPLEVNQDDRYIGRDPDAKVEHQPLVHLRYAEDASSTTPVVRNGVDDTNVAPAALPRPGIEVFTTDELVVALNQRLQEEGRWEIDESLPGYPESDQGRSR